MAGFRPVLLTLLLTIFLHRTEAAPAPSEFAIEGENITLPCEKVGQSRCNGNVQMCNGTTWIFNSAKKTETTKVLFEHGKISSSVPEMSHRLRVTQKCDLEIQNVRPQDAGQFHCGQFDQSGRKLPPDAPVYLSVVSLIRLPFQDKNFQIKCNVFSSLSTVKTKWLLNGTDIKEKEISTIKWPNGLIVKVPTSHSHYLNQLECEVTHRKKKTRFSLRSNKPVKMTTTTVTTQSSKTTCVTNPPPTEPEESQTAAAPQNTSTAGGQRNAPSDLDTQQSLGWLWVVLASVAGVLITVTVVVLLTWRMLREKPAVTRSNHHAEAEDEVFYAPITYNRNKRRNEVSLSEEEVIYSSVRKTGVEDPTQLYASVKK